MTPCPRILHIRPSKNACLLGLAVTPQSTMSSFEACPENLTKSFHTPLFLLSLGTTTAPVPTFPTQNKNIKQLSHRSFVRFRARPTVPTVPSIHAQVLGECPAVRSAVSADAPGAKCPGEGPAPSADSETSSSASEPALGVSPSTDSDGFGAGARSDEDLLSIRG